MLVLAFGARGLRLIFGGRSRPPSVWCRLDAPDLGLALGLGRPHSRVHSLVVFTFWVSPPSGRHSTFVCNTLARRHWCCRLSLLTVAHDSWRSRARRWHFAAVRSSDTWSRRAEQDRPPPTQKSVEHCHERGTVKPRRRGAVVVQPRGRIEPPSHGGEGGPREPRSQAQRRAGPIQWMAAGLPQMCTHWALTPRRRGGGAELSSTRPVVVHIPLACSYKASLDAMLEVV